MHYRKLGRTGLQVSEIGFGCGNVGGLFVRGSHQDQIAAIDQAVSLGINYFDTAAAYGNGLSEKNLGIVLKELKAPIILATKVRLTYEDLSNKLESIKHSLEASLKRLQRDSIDILQLHNQIAMERGGAGWSQSLSLNDVLGNNGIADVFDKLRSQGIFRFYGFTGLGEAEALLKLIESNRFDLMQAYFNLLNPSSGFMIPPETTIYNFHQIMDKAFQHDMGIAVIRVLAAGALAGTEARHGYASPTVGGPMVPGGDYKADKERAKVMELKAPGNATNSVEMAIRFGLTHPGVSVVLVGFSDIKQIKEAVFYADKGRLTEPTLANLKKLWATDFGKRRIRQSN